MRRTDRRKTTEKRPIRFEVDGMRRVVQAGDLVDQACEGVAGAVRNDEPIVLQNTCHPVNERVALAKATKSSYHAFGIDWDDTSGRNNGHFAPFSWRSS